MDDSDLIIVIVFIFGFLLIIIAFSNKKEPGVKRKKVTDRPDLIQDDKVTMKLVEEKIDGFKIFVNPKRKIGFTEKDVQIELESFLKDIFQNVTREHGVESKNAKAIDFDIGKVIRITKLEITHSDSNCRKQHGGYIKISSELNWLIAK